MTIKTGFFLGLFYWAASLSAASLRPDPFEQAHQDLALAAFEPNYFGIAQTRDDPRVEYQFSMKYGLIPLDLTLGSYHLVALDLAFTGLFDFYVFDKGYHSVIPRQQDPGAFLDLRANEDEQWAHLSAVQAGWFHESNGQEISRNFQLAVAGPRGPDKILRSWDYWYLSSSFDFHPQENLRLRIDPSARIFTDSTGRIIEDIFWRPNEAPSHISDFDGLRAELSIQRSFPGRAVSYVELDESFRTGYSPGHLAQYISCQVALTVKTWHLPWMFYYRNGYGAYITEYNSWSEGWGLALRVWG